MRHLPEGHSCNYTWGHNIKMRHLRMGVFMSILELSAVLRQVVSRKDCSNWRFWRMCSSRVKVWASLLVIFFFPIGNGKILLKRRKRAKITTWKHNTLKKLKEHYTEYWKQPKTKPKLKNREGRSRIKRSLLSQAICHFFSRMKHIPEHDLGRRGSGFYFVEIIVKLPRTHCQA